MLKWKKDEQLHWSTSLPQTHDPERCQMLNTSLLQPPGPPALTINKPHRCTFCCHNTLLPLIDVLPSVCVNAHVTRAQQPCCARCPPFTPRRWLNSSPSSTLPPGSGGPVFPFHPAGRLREVDISGGAEAHFLPGQSESSEPERKSFPN